MSAPLVPSPLDCIGRQRFGFFPAIGNAGPNEWVLGVSTWTEIEAVNARTGARVWIARSNIGGVSDHHDCLTVGLRKKLEYREGAARPAIRTVIEIPRADRDAKIERPRGPATIVAIRLERKRQSSMSRAALGMVVGGLVVALLAAWLGSTLLN